MEKPTRPVRPTRPDITPVRRNTTSYFEDNKQYSSDIINSILEELDSIRSVGNKLSLECYKIQNSISELEKSIEGLSDQDLVKRTQKKIDDLTKNLTKRNKILNDYNSLSERELSLFISDKLIGNDVVDINQNSKNKMFSVKRYTDGIIQNSRKQEEQKELSDTIKKISDLPSREEIEKMPAIPNKSKIPVPKNSYQVDEIVLFVKKFTERQNLHKVKLTKAFELYISNSAKTNS
jgi:uncharacterized protein YoxC